MLIVVEGIDGAGKDTILNRVSKRLNIPIWNSLDNNSQTGKVIREILAKREKHDTDSRLGLLFLSEMIYNVEKEGGLRDMLKKGPVIINRYYYSTLAYTDDNALGVTGAIMGLGTEPKDKPLIEPDLVLYIDAGLDKSIERLKDKQTDTYENREILTKVYDKYKYIMEQANAKIIHNDGDIEIAVDRAIELIERKINSKLFGK